jgi:short-subunit dehydrogenase
MGSKDMGAVVITGCSTGIGRASALHLDSLGFEVFAGIRKEEDAESLRRAASPRLTPLFIDVTDNDSIASGAKKVTKALDGRGLAGLVNNAGATFISPLEFFPWEELVQQVKVNLLGHIAVTQSFLGLIRRCRGRVVNIGSIGGLQPVPFLSAYDACKAGMHAYTDSLRMELGAQGIQVVLVIPGHIATPIWRKTGGKGESLPDSLPEEGRAIYGSMIDAFMQTVRNMEQGGLKAEAVAEVVARVLTVPKPNTCYLVGRDARLQSFLTKLAPDRIRDALVLKMLGVT